MESQTTEPGTTTRFQRRTVIVKKSLQYKYIFIIFFSVVLSALIVGTDVYYTMYRYVVQDNPALEPLLERVNSMIMVKMVLYLGIIFLMSLFVSHRFAGPIYRFEKSAQIVSTGDLTHRVSLRTGDDLLELQEEFNNMVASLQSQVKKERSLVQHLASRMEQMMKDLPEEPGKDGLRPVREGLKALKAELEHLTSRFKV